jgi:hypothetical protein
MSSKLKSKWDINSLLQITAQAAPNRYVYMQRDVIKSAIKIKKVTVYSGKNPGQGRTTFYVESSSFPNYYPYYTVFDKRGRRRAYQRTFRHTYDCVLQLDWLSIKTPVKIRIGSEKNWISNISPSLIKSKKNPNGQYLSIGDYNISERGINPDMLFTTEWYRFQDQCLYGKNRTTYAPSLKQNPYSVVFLTKHELWMCETLLETGLFATYSQEEIGIVKK